MPEVPAHTAEAAPEDGVAVAHTAAENASSENSGASADGAGKVADSGASADGADTDNGGADNAADGAGTISGASADGAQGGQLPEKPKKKRGWIWNIVLVVIIALGLWSLFGISGEITEGDGMTFGEAIAGINAGGAVAVVAVVLGVMITDCLKFCFVNKAVIGKVRPGIAIKTSFLGKFYDNITPFAAGGQPMQIYYMTTKGVDVSHSSAVVLIRYFGSIYAFTFIGAVSMIVGVATGVLKGVEGAVLLQVAGWIGLFVNLIIPVFIAFFVFFPKFAMKCTTWFINVGAKLRIVKNKERVMAKALKTVDDFVTSFKLIAKRPLWLVLFIICCIAENFLTFSVPFFVMNALSCDVHGMFFTILSLNVFTTFGVSFIPTPGNSGVIEGMGVLAFSVAAGNALAWAVLFWRFAVFYVYILIGLAITVFDLIAKNVKARRRGRADAAGKNGRRE